jgi:hypothetical protein
MGILKEPAALVEALRLPRGFSVCELGDQWMSGRREPLLAADWYRSLGCGRYVSIDGNGRGTITADLNWSLPSQGMGLAALTGSFDLVTDFGTGEHIFDQAQVWRTMHDLTNLGGYLVFDRPAQGYAAHCYYRVDLCLFHDVAAANGYTVLQLATGSTPRGELIRGVFRRPMTPAPFRVPQQGRYRDSLVIR